MTQATSSKRARSALAVLATWLIRGFLACSFVVITLVTALYFILDTQRGSDWLLTKGLAIVSPQATFTSYTGTLASGIQLKDLHLPLATADIDIASIDSAWNLWGILGGELPIHKLHIDQLHIVLHPTANVPAEPSPLSPWPTLSLPFPLNIQDARIQKITVDQDENIQTIDLISLQAYSGLLRTAISALTIKSKVYSATLSGDVNNRPPYKMHISMDWSLDLPEQTTFSGKGRLSGNLRNLHIKHSLTRPATVISDARISNWYQPSQAIVDLHRIKIELRSDWPEIALPLSTAMQGRLPIPQLSSRNGHLQISGSWDNYVLSLHSQLAAGANQGSETAKSSNDDTPSSQTIIAQVLKKPATFKLEFNGNKLAILLNTLTLDTEAGKLGIRGRINANGLLAAPSANPSQDQALDWQLKVKAENIDTASALPQWPIKLATNLDSKGFWGDTGYRADLIINTLSGDIAGKAIAGSGAVTASNKGQEFKKLVLQLGDNHLSANGKLLDKSELNWLVNAPKLSQILPQLSGSVSSQGTLRGGAITQLFNKGRSPLIVADLKVREFQYQQYRIAAAHLALSTNAAKEVSLQIKGEGISASPLNKANLDLKASGSIEQHQLALTVTDDDKQLALDLIGALKQSNSQYQWLSSIQDLSLNSAVSGPWQLAGSSALDLAANTVSLSTMCLQQDSTKVCANGSLQGDRISASGHIDALALERFTAASLPPGSAISGTLNSHFSIAGKIDDLSGDLDISSQDIVIRYQADEDQTMAEYQASLASKTKIQHSRLNTNAIFSIADIGSINANLSTQGLAASSEIQGDINGGFSNLSWLGGLFPQLENLNGVLSTQLAVSGQLAEPLAQGSLSLTDVKMELPDLGISLQNAKAELAFDSRGPWQLESKIVSGKGVLNISGHGALGGIGGPSGQLRISGDNITVLDRADGLVLISPDINASLSPELIKIRGTLTIPKGNYSLKTLPDQAAGVSADERIVNQQTTSDVKSRAIDTRVDIVLNDSFEFKGYGLSTRLGGQLKLSQKTDSLLQGFGSLSLYDGVYKAYGQKLNVERGLLIFQGPLDNPGLNITAIRETKTATVGVNIGGFAQDIRSELFSDPILPPTDVMAILITGKAPADLNKSDANQVMNAAAALGISQSRGISNTLQNTFGVDVVSLQGGDSYEDSSLVVGKYLNPDLFISYVQNLFTPAGSVQLDYTLSKNLGLKAQSGKAQSIDLLYKIEHGQQ
ncbi:translocation/assembly module TamB domain-containing protein [Zhongshania arctica]|uniref:Translocation/assembly module TamB domain-containing protein n=1 Tax=Zhongshania arctica TaxID=3238302 RepID=A0ABV3TVQ5_9GAMM